MVKQFVAKTNGRNGNQTIPPGSTITGTVPASHVWTVGENFGESIGPTPDLVLRYHPLPLPTSNTPEPLLLDLRTLPATASGPNWSYELTFAHALQMWHDNGPGWFSLRATWPDTGDALGDLLIAPFISTNLTSITYEV